MPRSFTPFAVLALAACALVVPSRAMAAAGFAFLEIPTGARASGLSGAYASVAQGVDAIFWNPAGLDGVRGVQVMGGHAELFQKLRHDHFAIAGRQLGGAIAVSMRALYSEPIEERDAIGNLVGSFGAHDLEFTLGYGATMAPGIQGGLTAQWIRERIANESVDAWALGVGGAWEPAAMKGLRLAASAHNLGPSARYTIDGAPGEPVRLPAAVHAGVSYQVPLAAGARVIGSFEERVTHGRNVVTLLGAELASLGGAAVRIGGRLNDEATAFSVGGGYGGSGFHLDYAWVPYAFDLGDTHRFSFSAQF